MRNFEGHVQIAGVRLGKLPMVRRKVFVGPAMSEDVSSANSQNGQAQVIIDVKSALWRFSSMLAFNHSLLNRE
jgi:hypothetical protein